jgi:hypothetical protein
LLPAPAAVDQSAQLIERVKRQKLNAAAAVDIRHAELFDGVHHHAIGATVAIRNGQANALAVVAKQHIIHAPGINADAVDTDPVIADFRQPDADLGFQAINIPGIKTVLLLQAVKKRCISRSESVRWVQSYVASITRPLDAPKSTATQWRNVMFGSFLSHWG